MWIESESSLWVNLQQNIYCTSNTTAWVIESVLNILEPSYLNSINYVIWRRLLTEKLKSWNTTWIASLLMEFLISRPEFIQEKYWKDDPNFLLNLQQRFKPQSDYYKRAITEIEAQSKKDWVLEVADNPAWFSLKTKNYLSEQNWLNFKIYLTIPTQWYDFISKIYQLWIMLNNLAKESWDKISLKVPSSILWFLSHSDSLVIHFKNSDNKEKIESILEEWKNINWVIEENRNLWRTKFAWDSSTNSFSGLVSNNIEKWILENYWKYDNELLSSLAMEYAIKQSQVPPKFK